MSYVKYYHFMLSVVVLVDEMTVDKMTCCLNHVMRCIICFVTFSYPHLSKYSDQSLFKVRSFTKKSLTFPFCIMKPLCGLFILIALNTLLTLVPYQIWHQWALTIWHETVITSFMQLGFSLE
jgi:hypothetical protein